MQGNDQLFNLLGEIDPKKPYGTALFDALARVSISVAIEAVCLREVVDDHLRGKTHYEVYMIQRSPNDTAYPEEWHCPGSVMRPGEEIEDVMGRLNVKEFDSCLLSWEFVKNFNHTHEDRGHFFSVIYRCKLKESNRLEGKWFPISGGPANLRGLPKKTVEHHRKTIISALWVPA